MENYISKIKVILFSLFLLALPALGNAQEISLEKAQLRAKEEGKTILLNFSGSDWCRSCILLKKTILDTEAFKEYADKKLVIVEADFPRSKKNKLSKEQTVYNEKLAAKYNSKGQFPTVILMDANLKVLGKTGYKKLSPAKFVEHIQSLINK